MHLCWTYMRSGHDQYHGETKRQDSREDDSEIQNPGDVVCEFGVTCWHKRVILVGTWKV